MIRIKNEEIESIYLLSIQQAERLPRYILAIGDSWWLRSPGSFSGAAEVDENSNVNYFGLKVDYNCLGVRPALTVKNLDSLNYEIGETVKVLGLTAQYIGDNSVLLCESIAKHRFDSKSNDYETSEIKQFIEEWLETKKSGKKHEMTREEAIENIEFLRDNPCIHHLTKEIENALGVAVEALNKQIGTKPYKIRWNEHVMRVLCPQCNYRFYSLIDGEKIAGNQSLYCPCCGQRIDWMEEEK